MINAEMKTYNYFVYGEKNAYGQSSLDTSAPAGTIKIAIFDSSRAIQDNIKYSNATYVGLTHANVDDTYVIDFEENERLKVLYVTPHGRYKQVFLAAI